MKRPIRDFSLALLASILAIPAYPVIVRGTHALVKFGRWAKGPPCIAWSNNKEVLPSCIAYPKGTSPELILHVLFFGGLLILAGLLAAIPSLIDLSRDHKQPAASNLGLDNRQHGWDTRA